MGTVGRILLQLAACGPVLVLYPFMTVLAAATLLNVAEDGGKGAENMALVVGGFIGVTGLLLSIFVPVAFARRHPWFRWTVLALMMVGALLAALFIGAESRSMHDAFFMAWFAGGPLLVAAWNTLRMFARAPIAPLPEAAR